MSTTTAKYLSDGRATDGVIVNRSDEYLGFFGVSPVAQQTFTQMVTPVLSQVATSGKWAFSNSTAAYLIFTRLRSFAAKFDTIGLVNL